MTRGNANTHKVHYKGKDEDFLVFVDDHEGLQKWAGGDTSIPLAHFISSFKIFVTHKQGAQGTYDGASKGILENEFGTSNEDDVIKKILEQGAVQETTMGERQGVKNDSMGSRAAH